MTTYPKIFLRSGADQRIRAGHLWVFSNELQDGFQSLPPGTPAELFDSRKNRIGIGTANPHSLIAFRIFSRTAQELDTDFLRQRIQKATQFRQQLFGDEWTVSRLIYSEADGLPGLIVDRFNDVLVVQSNTAGMENLQPQILEILGEQFSPSAIVAANDSSFRALEGLENYRKLLIGNLNGLHEFSFDGIRFLADPLHGQKTGFFLDQRDNRRLVARFLKPNSRVLDLFCYTGGFGLYALKAGASHVIFADASAEALEIVRQEVVLNGWADRVEFLKVDIFDYLKETPDLFEAVILDPPALVKSRTKVTAALRAYRDLNARAAAIVQSGGLLFTASCSGLVQANSWRTALSDAALKSGKELRILAQGHQSADHPILTSMPETEYLKFAVCSVD